MSLRVIFLSCIVFFVGCSPAYVMRAAYEQTKILSGRQAITDVVKSEDLAPETRDKLLFVLQAREYAQQIGLEPKDAFTTYTDIHRDVLLWVLTASEKTRFEPYTWWFPFVGSVPYKGFFDRDDADREFRSLKEKDFDVLLRPSPAFSTLGWFNDPLLSTTLVQDEISVVNTVFHELLHSNLWVKGSVNFNESLANFIGHAVSRAFYCDHLQDSAKCEEVKTRWSDELLYSEYFREVEAQLTALYAKKELPLEAILAAREKLFADAAARWQTLRDSLQRKGKRRGEMKLNNAVIIGQRLYLDRLDQFEKYFERQGSDIQAFLKFLFAHRSELTAASDPYLKLMELSTNFL